MANIFNGSCNIIIIGRTGPFINRVNCKSEYCFLASAQKMVKKGLSLHSPSALNDFILFVHVVIEQKRKLYAKNVHFQMNNKIEIRLEYDHFYSQNALYFTNHLNSQVEFHFFDAASLFGLQNNRILNETFHGELCRKNVYSVTLNKVFLYMREEVPRGLNMASVLICANIL